MAEEVKKTTETKETASVKKDTDPTVEKMNDRIDKLTAEVQGLKTKDEETQNELISSKAETSRLSEQLFMRDEKNRFDEAFDKAAGQGRVSPGSKENEWFVFNSLPRDSEKDVAKQTFKDGDKSHTITPREAWLRQLASRPEVVAMKELVAAEAADHESPGGGGSPEAEDAKLHAMSEQISADEKISYAEAVPKAQLKLKSGAA